MAGFIIPLIMAATGVFSAANAAAGRGKEREGVPGLPEGAAPVPSNYANPSLTQSLLNFLFSQFSGEGGTVGGLLRYPGQLNPNLADTMLPQLWDRISNNNTQNPGVQWMSDFLSAGGVKNPLDPFGLGADSDFLRFGAPVGEPFMRMQKIAQEGGTGGPGHLGLLDMLKLGGPAGPGTAAQQSMVNTGIAGPSGSILQAMALGQSNPASSFLSPFLKQMTYRPAEPTRRVA